MVDLDRPGLLDGLSHRQRELAHPSLAAPLKCTPAGILPIDDPRRFCALFFPIASHTMSAVADGRPERHVEENAFEIVLAHQLSYTSESVFRVWRVDTNSACALAALRGGVVGRQYLPIRMGSISPVVEDQTVIGYAVKTMLFRLLHDLAEVVTALHVAMHLSQASAPQGEAYVRIGVLHQ